ncbi:MAG: molecular chaperone [Burkholderiaceae bacterium]
MKPQKTLRALALSCLALCAAAPALAGVFSVTPVRIFMVPKDRAVAITIVNEGDTPVALQADINVWSQKPDGTDELVLTEDMILSPPIIKLEPKAKQVVRLALLKPADASRQLTYRMIVREVPEAFKSDATIQVPISLALSMPVFITPPIAKREMACGLTMNAGANPQAVCSNIGSAYAQVREVAVQRGGRKLARFEGGSYILPGAKKTLPLKTDAALAPGAAELFVLFDDGRSQTFAVTLP